MAPGETPDWNPLASRPALLVTVREEGWQRVTRADLAAAGGVGAFLRPEALRVFAMTPAGPREVPRLIADGALEFYGLGVDTANTVGRVYWLVPGPGLEPLWRRLQPAHAPPENDFPETIERRERSMYFPSLKNGEASNFFGPVLAGNGSAVEQTLETPDLAPGPVEVEVRVQGITAGEQPKPNHRVGVSLNGTPLGEIGFNGRENRSARLSAPAGVLQDGANTVSLQALNGDFDYSLVDTVCVRYRRRLVASGDRLRFTARGGSEVTVDGFSGPGVRLFDVTDPDASALVPTDVHPRGAGFSLRALTPGSGERVLYAVGPAGAEQPAAIRPHNPPAWLGARFRGADLLVVGPRSFLPGAAPLLQRRRSEGLTPLAAAWEDVRAAFSGGQDDPAAIRRLVAFGTSRWKVKPRWLLLLGDASADPRGYLGGAASNLVPTRIVETDGLEGAWDDWFAEGTTVGVGRLPARTPEDAALLARKAAQAGPSLAGRAVLVTGIGSDFDYPGLTAEVRSLLQVSSEEIPPGPGQGAAVRGAFQAGAGLVHYAGHGSNYSWAGPILSAEQARALVNGQLPAVVSMTCLNGAFHDWMTESLAEGLMLAPRGGASLVWASSGLTDAGTQAMMDRALFVALRAGSAGVSPARLTWGEAVREAKRMALSVDVARTWILFGDPSAMVR